VTPDLIKAIPNGGTMYQLAAMMPGVFISGGQDVGGSSGSPVGAQLSTHGGPGSDEVQLLDGVRVGNMMGGSRTQQTLSPLLYDEVDVQLSGQSGDAVSIGVTSNSIPRSGGNTFAGTILTNGSGPNLQTSNLTPRLQALGLTTTSTLRSLYDINGSIGGPIVKDRLWFYFTERYQTNSTYAAGAFYSANPLPTFGNLTRVATSEQGYNPQYLWDNTFRLTAALTQKLRVNGTGIIQRKWWPLYPAVSAALSPETNVQITWPGRIYQGSATYAATSRLLFEGAFNFQDSSDFWEPLDFANNVGGNAVRVVEQGTTGVAPITWGPLSPTLASDNPMHMTSYRAAMNYVTGTHSFKVGMDLQSGSRQNQWLGLSSLIQARTLGYQLNQVTLFAPPGIYKTNLDYDTGIFAQDRWTIKRLTLTGALRFDLQKESYDPTTIGPSLYLPNRAVQTIPGANVTDWKDLNPRFGLAYDVFGTGKTALKVSAARGVAGETIATAAALNPGSVTGFATSTAINVNDGVGGPKDNIPQCNFQNPLANGECGPWLTPTFGSAVPLTKQDPATLNGWNKRPWNWEFSAGIQQEISPRLSAGITYYRRIYGNFLVTDNTATTAADYTQYNLTIPTDARVPTSGQSLTYWDVNPVLKSGASGLSVANYNTYASNFGDMFQHWNGVDITGSSRLAARITATGGVTFGKALFDDCNVVAQLPEMLYTTLSSQQMCHFESGWAPQYKLLGSYILPWQNIRISGNLQSLPGPVRQASVLYTQAQITAGLGRPATVAGNKSVLAIEPAFPLAIPPGVGTPFLLGTEFGDRLNQLDLRFSKIFKFGRSTLDANFDIYNSFNSDAALTETAAYSGTNGGSWLLPTTVIQGRIIKFGVRWDF
jgi:hypothetical protein